jgi:hypothetical protein
MGDDLATLANTIKKTEKKLEKLEEHIDTIISSPSDSDVAAVEALVKQLRCKDSDAALESVRAEKVELDKRLNTLMKK